MVTNHVDGCSRSYASDLIRKGIVVVDGSPRKPGYRIRPGDTISGHLPPPEPVSCEAQPIEIDILYEDIDIIVVNKHAGFVVHPAPGNYDGTLVNALLHHCPDIEGIGGELRPGIVHRLDKDTTGVLVAAKNQRAHVHLSAAFKDRCVEKEYLALVYGNVSGGRGIVDKPIGRHPTDRKKMSTVSRRPRSAETHWKVAERLAGTTLLSILLKTGRTHQIRVHCASMNHPIVGDPIYGGRAWKSIQGGPVAPSDLPERQMRHARSLSLVHPVSGETMTFEAPLPPDMAQLIEKFRPT